MKFILLFITVFVFSETFSQQNKKYVDSLKSIIKKGLPDSDAEKNIKKQIKYIRTCEALGDYFKRNNDFKNALHYYLLVADLGEGTDSKLGSNHVGVDLRNKVCLKTGDIYFHGKGIKKNLGKALIYHTKGLIYGDHEKKDYYSKLYFHNTDRVFNIDEINSEDSMIQYAINPFYIPQRIFRTKTEYIPERIKIFMDRDSTLNCLLQLYTNEIIPNSEAGTSVTAKFLIAIKQLLLEEYKINADRIFQNVMVGDIVKCRYESYNLPCLKIRFTKESLHSLYYR